MKARGEAKVEKGRSGVEAATMESGPVKRCARVLVCGWHEEGRWISVDFDGVGPSCLRSETMTFVSLLGAFLCSEARNESKNNLALILNYSESHMTQSSLSVQKYLCENAAANIKRHCFLVGMGLVRRRHDSEG